MKNFKSIFIGAGLIAGIQGCSLEAPSREVDLRLDLSEIVRDYEEKASPSTISGFTCLGVNIVGPGIPDSSMNPTPDLSTVISGMLAGQSCGYRGVIAGPILPVSGSYPASELTLTVPSGANRLIQVFGIVDTRAGAPACATGSAFANDQSNLTPKAEIYEISRAKLDLMTGQTVSLVNNWPAGGDDSRRINCSNSSSVPAITINSITTSLTAVTNVASWTLVSSVTGTYNEYCWLENDTTVANCSWTAGSIPGTITVSGTNNAKVVSFWVRNTATGGISARYDLPSVTLDTMIPNITLIAPMGGESYTQSTTQNILWSSSDANLGANPVMIEFSQDMGVSYSMVASGVPNSGSFAWTVPVVMSPNCRIRITVSDLAGNMNQFSSPGNFSVGP